MDEAINNATIDELREYVHHAENLQVEGLSKAMRA